jgi:DNA-binding GntR family transcriptional regulator
MKPFMPSPRSADPSDITAHLRDAITRGQLMPNERLIEADLARAYGVNRANIRMALAMLDQEGLVVREPNRGARVRSVSDSEAIEIAETRLAVEGMVARRAAERATSADHSALRAIEAQMQQAIDRSDYTAFSQSNAALHREIQRIGGNETANRILQTLKTHLVRLQYRVILLPGRPETSLAEHRVIVNAICAGNGDAAEAAMRRHLLNFRQLLVQAIDAARHGGF